MWEDNLLIEPLSTPGVMAAKLLLPFGSVQDPPDQRGAHELLASLLLDHALALIGFCQQDRGCPGMVGECCL